MPLRKDLVKTSKNTPFKTSSQIKLEDVDNPILKNLYVSAQANLPKIQQTTWPKITAVTQPKTSTQTVASADSLRKLLRLSPKESTQKTVTSNDILSLMPKKDVSSKTPTSEELRNLLSKPSQTTYKTPTTEDIKSLMPSTTQTSFSNVTVPKIEKVSPTKTFTKRDTDNLVEGLKDVRESQNTYNTTGVVTANPVASLAPSKLQPVNLILKMFADDLGYNSSFIDKAQDEVNEVEAKEQAEFLRDLTVNYPVLSNIASVIGSLGSVQDVPEIAYAAIKGGELDPNVLSMTSAIDTIRGTTSEQIGDETKGQKVGNFAYQTGMSIADFLAALGTGPFSMATLGTKAATSGTKQAAERGVDARKAALTGLAQGAAEALFERYSIGNLKAMTSATGKGIKTAVTNILKQMGTEASEEAATEITNTITDFIINDGLSNLELSAQNYIQQGMSNEDARKQALKDVGTQVGLSALAGAVSGGIIGGGATAFQGITSTGSTQTNAVEEVINSLPEGDVKESLKIEYEQTKSTEPTQLEKEADAISKQETLNINDPMINATLSKVLEIVNQQRAQQVDSPISIETMLETPTVQAETRPTEQQTILESTVDTDTVLKERQTSQQIASGLRGLDESLVKHYRENPNLYTPKTHSEAEQIADNIYKNNSFEDSVNLAKELIKDENTAVIPLINKIKEQYRIDGNVDAAANIIDEVMEKGTSSAQFVESFKMLYQENDPLVAIRTMENQINRINKEGQEKFGRRWTKYKESFKLTEDEINEYKAIQPGDTQAIEDMNAKVLDRILDSTPSKFSEKLINVWKLSMLSGTGTHIRNVVSNALNYVYTRGLSDRVSALGQNAVKLFKPDFDVTQSILPAGKNSVENQISNEIFENEIRSRIENTNRFQDMEGVWKDRNLYNPSSIGKWLNDQTGALDKINEITGGRNKDSVLQAWNDMTYWLLGDLEDGGFVKANFTSRLSSYLKAQGITDINDIPNSAKELALNEAMKATYKDLNKVSSSVLALKQNTGAVGELILPFAMTPANIAVRTAEYTPGVGLGLSVKDAVKSGNWSQFFDDASKSMTGTAVMGLGLLLAKAGLITGPLSDDPDKRKFQEQMGMQPYSVRIGDKYYSYDWAQPTSTPFILASTMLAEMQKNQDEEATNIAGKLGITPDSLYAVGDAFLDMSFMETVQSLFNAGFGQSTTENITEELLSSGQGLIPAIVGATARSIDPNVRSTYSSGDFWDTQKNIAMSKIPVLSKQLPSNYDVWGNEVVRAETGLGATVEQFLSPGKYSQLSQTPIDKEIIKLFDATQDNTVFPRKADRSLTINGENIKLDNDQYSDYQRDLGQQSLEFATEYINSPEYNEDTNEQRVEKLNKLYNVANAMAKANLFGSESDTVFKERYIQQTLGTEGLNDYLNLMQDTDGSTSVQTIVPSINKMDLTDEEKGIMLETRVRQTPKTADIKNKLGYDGLYQYYNVVSNIENAGNSSTTYKTLIPELSNTNFSDEEKGYLLGQRVKLGESAQAAQSLFGDKGIYDYYSYVMAADSLGNGNGYLSNKEIDEFLLSSNELSEEEKVLWSELLK